MALYIRLDNRIRLTASALLLTRFCHEQSQFKWHPLKRDVLSHVTQLKDHPFAGLLSRLAECWFLNSFYSISFLLEPTERGYLIPKALREQIPELYSERYGELLWDFQQAAELERTWNESANLWDQTVKDCKALLKGGGVEEFLDLVYGPTTAQFIIVPNPLDPASFGFGIRNAEGYFSIVAPPAIPISDHREAHYLEWGTRLNKIVVHELSHSLLGTARSRYPEFIESTKHLARRMSPRGYFAKMYNTWEIQFDELFIRAIEALYLVETEGMDAARRELTDQETKYGISLVFPVFESLREYVQNRRMGSYDDLGAFLPELAGQMTKW